MTIRPMQDIESVCQKMSKTEERTQGHKKSTAIATKAQIQTQSTLPTNQQDWRGVKLKEIAWTWRRDNAIRYKPGEFRCHNEYKVDSRDVEELGESPLDRMQVFVVTVNDPLQLRSALELMSEALQRAPYQQREVSISSDRTKKGKLLPHVSVDCEFVKLPKDLADERPGWEAKRMVDDGQLEELVSVMTIAVGRHFFLLVNILHMLQTANKDPELAYFYGKTVFNPELAKLWWNPQSDFSVLDATIAHMYQGTVRPPFSHKPYREDARSITPIFRISNRYFNTTRPTSLTFPTDHVDCALHEIGYNEQGLSCSCRLGNFDLAALIDHVCRIHSYSKYNDNGAGKSPWTKHRDRFNYDSLLSCFLKGDRLYPLLQKMKSAAANSSDKHAFYQNLGGPGMVTNDDAMGYNIGDVAGQNLIFELLLASDDKRFVASCLSNYRLGYAEQCPNRTVKQHFSKLTSRCGTLLIEDNPRMYKSAPLKHGRFSSNLGFWKTEKLSFFEHEQRLQVQARVSAELGKPPAVTTYNLYSAPDRDNCNWAPSVAEEALNQLFDATKFWLPPVCVQRPSLNAGEEAEAAVRTPYDNPIVRAGTSHAQALVEFLRSPHAANAAPPPGFGADVGSTDGLPWFVRPQHVPGRGLGLARDIFEAFTNRGTGNGSLLGARKLVEHTKPRPKPIKEHDSIKHLGNLGPPDPADPYAWDKDPIDSSWGAAHTLRSQLRMAVEKEIETNREEGLPYQFGIHDVFDPEGRDYRRRVEGAAP
ncbi:hypothetical protein B0A49_00261 [Cryomyces minteri]|uniref:Uncharacterized protein n=1 Tax=Cryomyces minteri TaxID=331657 RepID=A0A4U0XUF6_9PEZI|nr:hypothetical protein B0A49_00261 [Cryomyces minteri]